jgi:CRP-like cAMP-binding protein
MSLDAETVRRCDNLLLNQVPDSELSSLLPHLELVQLKLKDSLFERSQPMPYVYFPCNCVISLLATMQDGEAVEVSTIGNEGFSGTGILIGNDSATETAICQIAGMSLRISTVNLKKFFTGKTVLQAAAQRYMQAYLSQITQSVACNRLHTLEERFARWVLMTDDRVQSNGIFLTQEFLAIMLGVHRPSVTLVARSLQQAGVIKYNRGTVTVVDRAGLEEACCECYEVVKQQFIRLLGQNTGWLEKQVKATK